MQLYVWVTNEFKDLKSEDTGLYQLGGFHSINVLYVQALHRAACLSYHTRECHSDRTQRDCVPTWIPENTQMEQIEKASVVSEHLTESVKADRNSSKGQ